MVAKRDVAAALLFFRKAIPNSGESEVVTIDKSGVNTAVLDTHNAGNVDEEIIIANRSKYLKNLIVQDFICWLPEKKTTLLLLTSSH